MVKFRGIEIVIVSQFDIRRLPEFAHRISPVGAFNATSATCYVPIYPGCQIWFEYTVDGPHPPEAAYFFKLFINNQFITSWDCTAKYGYHGKTSYYLQLDEHGSNVCRRAFQFTNVEEDNQKLISLQDDCIEIRVYRIEHRQRTRSGCEIPHETYTSHTAGKLKLVSGGILEPGRPHRRYKYQLLDPLDVPHARFRFFFRDYDWLETHGLLNSSDTTDDTVDSSVLWYDPTQGDILESSLEGHGSPDYAHPWIASPERSPLSARGHGDNPTPPKHVALHAPNTPTASRSIDPHKKPHETTYLTLNNPNSSLSLLTKGSIEDLHSNVPRSPQSLKSTRSEHTPERRLPDIPPPSPHYSPPKFALKGVQHKTPADSTKKRPLSPFTSGGFLRKIRSPTPPPVPESIEQVCSECRTKADKEDDHGCSSSIMKYLSRQIHRKSPRKE